MVFRSLKKTRKKCVYFVHNCLQFLQLFSFAYTTSKPSHHNHSIIPLSNHHTIIIPKSHNLRNIYLIPIWIGSIVSTRKQNSQPRHTSQKRRNTRYRSILRKSGNCLKTGLVKKPTLTLTFQSMEKHLRAMIGAWL